MRLLLPFLIIGQFCYGQVNIIKEPNDSLISDSRPADTRDTTISDELPEEGDLSLRFLGDKEVGLGIITLAVLLLILILSVWLIRQSSMSEDLAVRLILSVVIILSTLFLVVAGYNDKTIAPAFGLFGTVLGYIFGRSSSKPLKDE